MNLINHAGSALLPRAIRARRPMPYPERNIFLLDLFLTERRRERASDVLFIAVQIDEPFFDTRLRSECFVGVCARWCCLALTGR